jgi:TolB-like protein/Tfp pilus assembly protein PilF
MGTVSYMSPEQAAGAEVDARSDLWSLGVVTYELVAGQLPFTGKDIHRQIIAIQEQAPLPLSRHTEGVPERLEEIVTKALAKDRDERYQTAKDLLIDLRHLKKRLEVDAELDRTVPPELRSTTSGAGESAAPLPTATASQSAAPTAALAHATSSAEYLIGEIKRHKRSVSVALAVLVLALAGLAYFFFRGQSGQALDSIAVLPFANASNDPNTEYLSDGISETLINSLSQLQRLRVVARTTAFRYKGREADPQAVGRELNVRAVLTGRVRQMGDALNIQADLVDAATGAQLWGEEYHRKVADLLAVKQEISREITEKLRLRLSGEEQKQLTRHDTANTEAYQFYLRGRYYWNKRAAESIKKAIQEFQQAADKDPNYALALVGLADCYVLLEEYAGTPASETLPQAKAFATRALQIDDSLGEAHASLGLINSGLWQWAEAERHFKRAIELNPNYPTAHHWYSVYLRDTGRFEEANSRIKRAQELDPLSSIISVNVGFMYLAKGEADSAVEQLEKTIELDPAYWTGRSWLGLAYLKQGRHDEALAELHKGVELSHRANRSLAFLGYANATIGKRSEAVAIIKELEEKHAKQGATVQNIAMVYAGLGDQERAFAWLEKNFQARSGELSRIVWYPQFESLRSDPRYADLLQRMGLKL